MIDAGPRLGKRQDPEPSTTESTPVETPSSSTPIETSTPQSTSATPTTPTTSSTPVETSTAAPSSTPVTSSSPTPVESSTLATSTILTDPIQSSAVASQSSISTASAISTQSIASNTNAGGGSTQIVTSFLTNGAGSTVTVVFTSTSAGPTASPSNSGSSNTGAIVGGVVGGVGGLLLLVALLWLIRRKTHKDKYEENMFAPDRNVDRGEMDLAGDDVHDPEAIARPYHLPPSPTRNEMAMSAGARPLSAQTHDRPLSGQYDETAAGMSGPTLGSGYYTQPGSGMEMPMPMTMPMPMPMSRDHVAYTQSQATSTYDQHTQPSEPTTSEGGSSSARLMKEREARRLHVANDDGGVIVHSDGGRVDEETEDNAPREIPPTYESISGPSGAR